MKSKLPVFTAASIVALGLLAVLSGCANTPTRQATQDALAPMAYTAAGFEAPVPTHTVAPLYPFDMKRAGISGVVNINCTIDEAGRVRDPEIKNSSHTDFDRPALAAIVDWRFKPATRDGVPVPARVSIPIQFTVVD